MKIKLPFIKRKTYDRVCFELGKDLDAWEIRYKRLKEEKEEKYQLFVTSLTVSNDTNKGLREEIRELQRVIKNKDKGIKVLKESLEECMKERTTTSEKNN